MNWDSYDWYNIELFPPVMKDRLDYLNQRTAELKREMEIAELQNKILQQRYAMEHNCSDNSLATGNIFYDIPKKVEPFIVVYRSKPIRGIILELWGKNSEYNWQRGKLEDD